MNDKQKITKIPGMSVP